MSKAPRSKPGAPRGRLCSKAALEAPRARRLQDLARTRPCATVRRATRPTTTLYGIATAVPAHTSDQLAIMRFMERVIGASHPPQEAQQALPLLRRIYGTSAIQRRHTCLADFEKTDPQAFEFFPHSWSLEPFPTTAQRMQRYESLSVALAEEASRKVLERTGVLPDEVTHLVVSSCTGFFAPGLDIVLAQRLGLAPGVSRTLIGFMGCHAGLSGLRTCDQIVRAAPGAVVLQVAVELCSLHFQKDLSPDTLVANCLFGDGCSAALYAGPGRFETPLARVLAASSLLSGNGLDQMSWRVGDTGFVMRLSPKVPQMLGSTANSFVEALARNAGLQGAKDLRWAIHPGGRKILDVLRQSLELTPGQIASSYEVLRDFGNMSSATILFVIQRELDRATLESAPMIALAFGPGLTIEGAALGPPAE